MIDQVWYTERLRISDSRAEDLPQLERILISNSDTLRLDGFLKPDLGELQRWLFEGDLPPNGQKERHRLQSISRKDNDEIIGYLSVYHGYPDPENFYIASLFIRQDFQNSGFGGEVVGRMSKLNCMEAYPMHRVVVTVRNWRAVQFWIRQGFTNIAKAMGNLQLEDGASARLELVRWCNVVNSTHRCD